MKVEVIVKGLDKHLPPNGNYIRGNATRIFDPMVREMNHRHDTLDIIYQTNAPKKKRWTSLRWRNEQTLEYSKERTGEASSTHHGHFQTAESLWPKTARVLATTRERARKEFPKLVIHSNAQLWLLIDIGSRRAKPWT